jgi:hypothetical protein
MDSLARLAGADQRATEANPSLPNLLTTAQFPAQPAAACDYWACPIVEHDLAYAWEGMSSFSHRC